MRMSPMQQQEKKIWNFKTLSKWNASVTKHKILHLPEIPVNSFSSAVPPSLGEAQISKLVLCTWSFLYLQRPQKAKGGTAELGDGLDWTNTASLATPTPTARTAEHLQLSYKHWGTVNGNTVVVTLR